MWGPNCDKRLSRWPAKPGSVWFRLTSTASRCSNQGSRPGPGQVCRTQVDQLTDQATWRQLQATQTAHDQQFNSYICHLDRPDQLRLYARHIARLPYSLAEAINSNGMTTFYNGRLGDIVIFGLRLPILLGSALPDQPVDQPRWLSRRPSPQTT